MRPMSSALQTRGHTAGSHAGRRFRGKQQDDATVGRGGYNGGDVDGENDGGGSTNGDNGDKTTATTAAGAA